MSYQVRRGPGVTQAIERLAETDPDGAYLVAGAFLALAQNPRPADVHVLSVTAGLYRLHLDRLDPDTKRSLRYRILYRIDDGDLVVIAVAVGALPRPSRRPR